MKQQSLLTYDVIGAAATLAVAGIGFWSGLVHLPQVAGRQADLDLRLDRAQKSLSAAEADAEREMARAEDLESQLASRGALPHETPVEENLRTVTQLARQNDVELMEVQPDPARKDYSGITELRYTVRSRGLFASLVDMLADFEQAGIWADVTQLKMTSATAGADGDDRRVMELAVSLFASNDRGDATQATP
jgi:hypothetical protein